MGAFGLQLGYPQAALADGPKCSLDKLKGAYTSASDGWDLTGGTMKPFAYAVQDNFDGKGNLTKEFLSQNVNGVYSAVQNIGTYTLDSNCKGTLTITIAGTPNHWDIFASPEGDDFAYVQTDPGLVNSGVETRISK
jgi:hypothetical protein